MEIARQIQRFRMLIFKNVLFSNWFLRSHLNFKDFTNFFPNLRDQNNFWHFDVKIKVNRLLSVLIGFKDGMICAESMGAFLGLECSRRKLRVFSQNFINVKGLIPEIDLLIKFIVSAFHVLSIYDYQHQTYIFQCFIKNYYRI